MGSRSKDKLVVHRAKWILPVSSPPIENGAIVSKNGRILEVGRADKISTSSADLVVDVEDGVIIPGLINAHTHLEFSDLESPLGGRGMSFTDWIGEVIRQRSNQTIETSKNAAIAIGVKELIATGTVAAGEIATGATRLAEHFDNINLDRVHIVAFLEQLGRNEDLFPQRAKEANSFVRSVETFEQRVVRPGLSPHAPYSVHPQLLKQLVNQAIDFKVPLAMHLAETREEIELIKNKSGPFVDLLESLGVWKPETFPSSGSILSILKTLAEAPSALIIHGNLLTESDLDFVYSQPSMSIVFCPRTHAYFNHSKYPIEAILRRQINLAVGTDSRASNPDLNLLSELKQIAKTFPQIPPATILEIGTRNGAKALGLSSKFGSIEAGKISQLSIVKTTHMDSASDWINDNESKAVQLVF